MASSSSIAPEAFSRSHTYNRKQKSLGLLCSNFLTLYNLDGIETIAIGDAASRLGVERRRIYDIVNVMESIGVLERKAKNQYSWKGFGGIPKALQELKEQGFKDNSSSKDGCTCGNHNARVSEDDEDTAKNQNEKSSSSFVLNSSDSPRSDNRREKSLSLLTQNFVKLFLCCNANLIISLEDAAKLLLGDGHDPSTLRTKVRRLYDIANVLSSMDLIEKTHTLETKKQAFKWLGVGGKYGEGIATVSALNESKKRMFGTDLTNASLKKSKMDLKIEKQVKHEHLEDELDKSSLGKDSRESMKAYHFGPFAPVTVCNSENTIVKKINWESLASSHRPQYHNQALKDLFGHYVEAWKSWYSQVGNQKPTQQFF